MTHKPRNAGPVILPAVVVADAPGLKAAGEDLASFRERLRHSKHFFVVDDSEDACRMNTEILSKPYGGRGGFETDPKKALDEIVKRVSRGELDVLVVDMDMPGMSGRELLLELAKKGIFVPFVIVSGGQGSEETRAFMSQLSSASSVRDMQNAVESRLKDTGGLAFAYVRKEDVALNPELLLNVADAMLLAGERKVESLELLVKATEVELPDFKTLPKDARERLFASMSDACLNWVSFHNRFLKDLDKSIAAANVPEVNAGKVKKAREKLGRLFQKPEEYSYDRLVKMDSRQLVDFHHDLFGSVGMQKAVNNLVMIERSGLVFAKKTDEERMKDLLNAYKTTAGMFKDRFNFIEQELKLAAGGVEAVDLRVLAMMTASDVNVKLAYDAGRDKAGIPSIEVDKKQLNSLQIAFKQALNNAGRAVEGKTDGEVRLIPGFSTVDGLEDAGVQAHFNGRDYGDADRIAFITIADNGPGMPESVLTAWRAGAETHRGGTGEVTSGLRIMREAAGEVNDGTVSIESSAGGTEVTFYFAEKQKNRGKT